MMGLSRQPDAPVTRARPGLWSWRGEMRGPDITPHSLQAGRDACPVFHKPSALGVYAMRERYEDMEPLHLADCMLCGSCSYVCPSNIPLAQLFSFSKAGLRRRKAAVVT
jgi:electron transport complex protein RnfC